MRNFTSSATKTVLYSLLSLPFSYTVNRFHQPHRLRAWEDVEIANYFALNLLSLYSHWFSYPLDRHTTSSVPPGFSSQVDLIGNRNSKASASILTCALTQHNSDTHGWNLISVSPTAIFAWRPETTILSSIHSFTCTRVVHSCRLCPPDSQLLPPISFSNNSKNNQSEGDVTPVSFNSSAHPRQVFLIFHRIGFAPSLRDFSQSMASRREIIYISDYSSPDSHGRSRLTIIQSRRNHKRRQRHRERWPLPLPINIDGECGICLETYREDNMIVTLMCHHHHHFHRHCIDVGCKQERVAQFVGELLKYHWEWDFLEDW